MSDCTQTARQVMEQSRIEERLSRGTRLRLKELAELAGVSKRKILDDVRRKELDVQPVKCGQCWRFEVEPIEARRYLQQLLPAA